MGKARACCAVSTNVGGGCAPPTVERRADHGVRRGPGNARLDTQYSTHCVNAACVAARMRPIAPGAPGASLREIYDSRATSLGGVPSKRLDVLAAMAQARRLHLDGAAPEQLANLVGADAALEFALAVRIDDASDALATGVGLRGISSVLSCHRKRRRGCADVRFDLHTLALAQRLAQPVHIALFDHAARLPPALTPGPVPADPSCDPRFTQGSWLFQKSILRRGFATKPRHDDRDRGAGDLASAISCAQAHYAGGGRDLGSHGLSPGTGGVGGEEAAGSTRTAPAASVVAVCGGGPDPAFFRGGRGGAGIVIVSYPAGRLRSIANILDTAISIGDAGRPGGVDGHDTESDSNP